MCALRTYNSIYQVPCRHTIHPGDVYDPSDFQQRFFSDNSAFLPEKSTIFIKINSNKNTDLLNQNIKAKLQPFAALGATPEDVANVFLQAFGSFNIK